MAASNSSVTGSRRRFLQATVAGSTALAMAARSYGRVAGANERIGIGVIGCGVRGFGAHLPGVQRHAKAQNVEINAICDVWTEYRERAVAQVQKWFGRQPLQCTAYRELLDHKEVDAVMIATCDFHHARMLEDAAQAGKDAYCEKPLAMDWQQLQSAVQAVRESGIVVQIGTQRRSDPYVRACRRLCQAGVLGQINRIEVCLNRNRPNWYKRLVRLPIKASEVDWDQFLMDRPRRPFNDLLFAGWYGFREFCGGSIGQFMSHYSDLVHFLTGATFPASAVAQGQTFVWKDDYHFDCRDQVQTSLIYPEGFLFTYATNFGNGSGNRTVIYGTEGVLDMTKRQPVLSPEGAYGTSKIREKMEVQPEECPDHFLDWLQCLRSRRQPVAPLEAGLQHSVACIMADRAMLTGRRQVFDADKNEIRAG